MDPIALRRQQAQVDARLDGLERRIDALPAIFERLFNRLEHRIAAEIAVALGPPDDEATMH